MKSHMVGNVFWIAAVSLLAPVVPAQAPDNLDGNWQLTATAGLTPSPKVGAAKAPAVTLCTFEGTATLSQNAASFGGSANLQIKDGPIFPCPLMLSGTLSGEAGAGVVEMGMILDAVDDAGKAEFSGTATRGRGPASSYSGTFLVTGGAFNGTNGTWTATRAPAAGVDIPALDAFGLAALAAILLAAAALLLRRRRAAARTGQ